MLVRRVLRCALLVAICLTLLPGPAGWTQVNARTQPAQPDTQQEANAKLDSLASALQELRAGLDRTAFDPDALALELAFEDAQTIAHWVRDQIAFEQYAGLLRGAQGTLMSRAGNSLDQSVLLAGLLNDAGYQVQIARTRLEPVVAETLLQEMFTARAPAPPAYEEEQLAEALEQLGDVVDQNGGDLDAYLAELSQPAANTANPVLEEVARETDRLVALLEEAGVELGGEVHGQLVEEARDYFWVQYRIASGEPWSSAHPAFGSQQPPSALEAVQTFDRSVPQELQHRLRVRVVIEQKNGEDLLTHDLMTPWERPIANLVGFPLTVTNVPSDIENVTELADPERLVNDSSLFVPLFNGELPDGAQFFDARGNVVPPDAAQHPAAGVFQEVGGAVNEATGALGGLGQAGPATEAQALTAQWIEYVLIRPGGEETVHRRMVYDRLGPAARAEERLDGVQANETPDLSALLTRQVIMVSASEFTAGFLAETVVGEALDSFQLVEELYDQIFTGGEEFIEPSAQSLERIQPLEPLVLFSLFDDFELTEAAIGYRAQPALLVVREGLRDCRGQRLFAEVDVIENRRRVLRLEDGQVRPAARQAIRAGVWETRAEQTPISGSQDATHQNTLLTMQHAREAGVELKVLEPGAVARSQLPQLDPVAQANLQRDLDAGYTVLAPQRMLEHDDGRAYTGWWRVRADTGETLGIGDNGSGQDLAEWQAAFQAGSHALMSALTVSGTIACLAGNDSATQKACCLAELAVVTGAGFGIGAALGKLTVQAAGLMAAQFVALDVAAGSALAIPGLLPSFCD